MKMMMIAIADDADGDLDDTTDIWG